jgi:hypothetical protein
MWGIRIPLITFDRLDDAVGAAVQSGGPVRVKLDAGDTYLHVTILRQIGGSLRAFMSEDVAVTDLLSADEMETWLRGPAPKVVLAGHWVLSLVGALRRGEPLPKGGVLEAEAERVDGGFFGFLMRWQGGSTLLMPITGREGHLRGGILDGEPMGHPRNSPAWTTLLDRIAGGLP